MAVDAQAAGEPGLLLAGDAAGFIDPMTGDGLRFALAGAELAAAVALEVLAGRVATIARTSGSRARRQRGVSCEVAVQSRVALAGRVAARRERRGAAPRAWRRRCSSDDPLRR